MIRTRIARYAAVASVAVLASAGAAGAQKPATSFSPAMARRADVRAALAVLERDYPQHLREWIRLTEIPAPSRHEQARAAYLREQMQAAGLEVTTDSIGNVTGRRKGTGGGPTVVIATHMDTVHPVETDVHVRQSGDTLRAPGVFDNTASLADALAVVRAMNEAHVQTRGDLLFVATVQEELGLKGMDWWLAHNPGRAQMVVAMDGGLGPVNYGALGIYWTRYHFTGEGSHTNTSAGKPSPARGLADAIRSIYEIQIPDGQGGAVYNVGILAGGQVFNAIAQDVSFTMDLRSVNPALLDSLDHEIDARVAAAARGQRVGWSKDSVVRNAAGGTEAMLRDRRAHPIVQTALDVQQHLGIAGQAEATGSTDANMAVVRGIPAIAVGRAIGGGQHTLGEWALASTALPASRMLLLLVASLAGVR
ncbi:MAG TPA: M20/M25/M40 family metallo-hydrolase [Longimicrobiaceae bacterium]|nr:M20/M25/M40 family metallo-hydrolase [Longimicrobiaceae bacterium]